MRQSTTPSSTKPASTKPASIEPSSTTSSSTKSAIAAIAPCLAPTRFIGCDVGKASIVVFDSRSGRLTTIPNRRDPLEAFVASLDDACLIVCEATGGYEDALLDAAVRAGRAAHRADARKVKAFIRSFGILGKTDAIDAKALAIYAEERHARLTRWQPSDPARDRLQALVLTRRDLVDQRVAFTNRRGAPGAEPVARYLEALLACLNTQITALDAEVEALIRVTDRLKRAETVLRTIAGIGAKTAAALLALMPELGHIDRRKAAALAGLAPHPNQSGGHDASRRTKGGRPDIKQILFMPSLSAARHDPTLSIVYKRLIANGKKPMVATIAIMRKIIVIANARLRDAFENVNAHQAAI